MTYALVVNFVSQRYFPASDAPPGSTLPQMRRGDANSLAFWMANASEYLHFLKQDRHVSAYSRDAQDILAESVQSAFW